MGKNQTEGGSVTETERRRNGGGHCCAIKGKRGYSEFICAEEGVKGPRSGGEKIRDLCANTGKKRLPGYQRSKFVGKGGPR